MTEIIDNYTALRQVAAFYYPPIYIYTLSDEKSIVRYVGKTITPRERFMSHKLQAKKGDMAKRNIWVRSLLEKGLEPKMTVIEQCHLLIADKREKYWIYYYSLLGCDLVNTVCKPLWVK